MAWLWVTPATYVNVVLDDQRNPNAAPESSRNDSWDNGRVQ